MEAHIKIITEMVENMFFLDSEHAGMGGMLPPKKLLFLLSGGKQVQVEDFTCNPPWKNILAHTKIAQDSFQSFEIFISNKNYS